MFMTVLEIPHDSNGHFSPEGQIMVRRKLVVVLGSTGTGKSSLIAQITGQPVQIGHDLRSCK